MRAVHMGVLVLAGALLLAQNPSAILNLTATSVNVSGAPDPVRIEILRWSTDEERPELAAWNLKPTSTEGPPRARPPRQTHCAGACSSPHAHALVALARPAEVTTVGYLWSSELAGYALRFA
jgi:hypothetical protein